jgi:hypothetical protein
MQLPIFISRALSFFDKAEANLTAEAKLTTALASIAEFTSANAKLGAEITKLTGENAALVTQVADLKASGVKAATDADAAIKVEQQKTTETLAGLGLDPAKIPAKAVGEPAVKGDLVAQYNAMTDPQAKVLFYRANKAAIDASWNAQFSKTE